MKVLAIVQARMGSTRLPGKVLMNIHGKPMLSYLINSLKYSKLTDEIVIATTSLPEDNPIEILSKSLKVKCYRGHPVDVLDRYYQCSTLYEGDVIARLTADNPIVIPELVDEIISLCKDSHCDYVTNALHRTYPLGIDVESFSFSTLKKLHESQKDILSREHVTYHILQNLHLYNIKEILAPKDLMRPQWRLTVDHIEDFRLMSEILPQLLAKHDFLTYDELVKFLDKNQELIQLNQKYNPQGDHGL